MHSAQFFINPKQSREVSWNQVAQVRRALSGRAFAIGTTQQTASGDLRTVLVERHDSGSKPSMIEVIENPSSDSCTLVVRSGDRDAFSAMVSAVEQNVESLSLSELAARARMHPSDIGALSRLGVALDGVRFDRDGYEVLRRALLSVKPAIRVRAAKIATELGWRSLLRPMWAAIARQRVGTPVHAELAAAFAKLDASSEAVRLVLSREMILEDVVTLSRISVDFAGNGLRDMRTKDTWAVSAENGDPAWRVFHNEEVLILEISEEWSVRARGLIAILGIETRVMLLEAATEKRAGALLRLASSATGFDPMIDELLCEGLRSSDAAHRQDALLAIATSDWDAATPDLEDVEPTTDEKSSRQLLRAILISQRGY